MTATCFELREERGGGMRGPTALLKYSIIYTYICQRIYKAYNVHMNTQAYLMVYVPMYICMYGTSSCAVGYIYFTYMYTEL